MSDDFNFETLSDTWNQQQDSSVFDSNDLKKRLFLHKFTLASVTFVELMIFLALLWSNYVAYSDSWSMLAKIWLTFGLIITTIMMFPIIKSRLASFKVLELPTSDWIDFQVKLSREALFRVKLTNYLISSFSIALVGIFIYEISVSDSAVSNMVMHYTFGVVWLLGAWIINVRRKRKYFKFIKSATGNVDEAID